MSHETSNLGDSAAQTNSNRCRSSTPRVWIRGITAAIVVFPASLLLAYGFLYLRDRAFNQNLPQAADDWVSYPGPSGTATSDGMGIFHSDLYGTGDLPAFLFWTIGLSITLLFLTAGLTRTTHGQSKIIKSVSWLSLGPTCRLCLDSVCRNCTWTVDGLIQFSSTLLLDGWCNRRRACNSNYPSRCKGRLTSRGRKARLRRVTFDVFAQFSSFHTMRLLLNF